MLDSLFGEGQTAFKVLFALIVVLGLLALAFWALRRFGGERLGSGAARGRQPRLAVIDAAMVDGRRRLILIRRDNVEHLLIIGGPTDVVVEQNIVRSTGTGREAPPVRPAAAPEPLPRAVPLGEGSMWPLQPEPPPRAEPPRVEPPRIEPPRIEPRPQRPAPVAEEPQWMEEPEPPPPPPPRQRPRPRAVDPLAGLAEELGRSPDGEPLARQAEPPPRQAEPRLAELAQPAEPPRPAEQTPRAAPRRAPRPQPVPAPAPPAPAATAEGDRSSAADQNLAEMAQRLEAALRRPVAQPGARASPPPAEEAQAYDEPAPPRPPAVPRPARLDAARPARAEAKAAPQKSLYDSLEQEMASLLGRPDGKT